MKIISFAFGIKKCSIKAVLCSEFCGYPSGAVCARNLYERGEIDIKEAQRLICYTNNAGPLFLISAVGTSLLGSTKDGVVIYLIQLISSFIYGILKREKVNSCSKKKRQTNLEKSDFCSYVKNGVNICVNICGFMVASYVMASAMTIFIRNTFGNFANSFYVNAFVKGFFEITAGINEFSSLNSEGLKFALICGTVSWSGFSVIMQIKSVSGKIIDIKKLCGAKFIQALFSFVMGLLYKSFFYKEVFRTDRLIAIPVSIIGTILIFVIYLFYQKSRYKKFI
ncbi:MAG: hypothetical protein J6R68_06815 [Clostridia bacterium]|nr:hypothetical protein [Clostridia bacterium]